MAIVHMVGIEILAHGPLAGSLVERDTNGDHLPLARDAWEGEKDPVRRSFAVERLEQRITPGSALIRPCPSGGANVGSSGYIRRCETQIQAFAFELLGPTI